MGSCTGSGWLFYFRRHDFDLCPARSDECRLMQRFFNISGFWIFLRAELSVFWAKYLLSRPLGRANILGGEFISLVFPGS
jgi:hypothetical protein